MRLSDLLRSLDVGSLASDLRKLFSRVDDNFQVLKRALSNQITLSDNVQCDIVTTRFDSGTPTQVSLRHLKNARSGILLGSAVPAFCAPIVASSGRGAVVTLHFAQNAKSVLATVALFDEGTPAGPGSLLATANAVGLVRPDDSTVFVDRGVLSTASTLPPSGVAGGDLAGTYPNPTLAVDRIPKSLLTVDGDMITRAAGVPSRLPIGAIDQVITVAGGAPTWADGSKKTLTTAGDLLYASAPNTLARKAIGNIYDVLTAGDPPIFAWAPGSKSTLTAVGDLLTAVAPHTLGRVAVGTGGQVLTAVGGIFGWLASATSTLTAAGDLLYASAANTLARLAVGSSKQVLTTIAGVPAWVNGSLATLTTVGDMLYAKFAMGSIYLERLAVGATGAILQVAGGVPTWVAAATPWYAVVGGPDFQNFWTDYGAPTLACAFCKDAMGFVHLRGTCMSGTVPATIFTLTAGYRPSAQIIFAVRTNTGFGSVSIESDGTVNALSGDNGALNLDGITFDTRA